MAPFSPGERELLRAVRDLVRADSDMRRDAGTRMRMNANELRAVRFVMEAARSGTAATPRGLATFLRVSTASTTTMLDRLVAAGHLDRVPHPTDRRSKVLVATPRARREARAELGGVHERMRAVAAAVPAEARPAVLAFLDGLAGAMREDDGDDRPPAGSAGRGTPRS